MSGTKVIQSKFEKMLCLNDAITTECLLAPKHFFKFKIRGYFPGICFNSIAYIAYVSSRTLSAVVTRRELSELIEPERANVLNCLLTLGIRTPKKKEKFKIPHTGKFSG